MSDIQVIPSKLGEALGNVVIEGMASGIKQIVTNDGGIPEIAKYSNSYIIEKDNLEEELYQTIIKIIKEKDYRKEKIQQEILKKFSQTVYSENFLKIIGKN